MDSVPLPIRVLSFLQRAIAHVLFRVKRTLGLLAQSVQQDELRELKDEARVLGSASAESITHVGAELREINARLAKLERDIERVGRLLDERGEGDPELEKHSDAPAQSLSTE
jgi:hypothetical protein